MGRIESVVYEKFNGTKFDGSPLEYYALGKLAGGLDVYGDGTYIKQRPGLMEVANLGDVGGGTIIDMARGSLADSVNTYRTLGDNLFIVAGVAGDFTHRHVYTFNLYSGALADLGHVSASAESRWDRRIIQCTDRMLVTSEAGFPNNAAWVLGGASYALSTSSLPPAGYSEAALHRNVLHVAKNFLNTEIYNWRWSDYDDMTTYPAANDADLLKLGVAAGIGGLKTATDRMYVFRPDSVWMLTGATSETYRIERLTEGIGGADGRGYANVDGTLVGPLVENRERSNASNYVLQGAQSRGIFAISADGVKRIDEDWGYNWPNTPTPALDNALGAYWRRKKLIMLRPTTAGNPYILAVHHPQNFLWPWATSDQVNAMIEAPVSGAMRLLVAIGAKIYAFDDDTDDGCVGVADLAPIRLPKGATGSIEELLIDGSGGGTASFQYSIDGGGLYPSGGLSFTIGEGVRIPVAGHTTNKTRGNVLRGRITFGTGVGPIYRIEMRIKIQGGGA